METPYNITIRFYEELNYFIKKYPLKVNIPFAYTGKRSVKDLIESFGVPHVEVDLILVNGKSVPFEYIVKNGDHISVYPVFERLNIKSVSKLRDHVLRNNRFVLDVHLGKLARHLRLLGFDADYKPFRDDKDLAEISSRQHRILLTRDRQLLMRSIVQRGLILRSDNAQEQIIEVLKKLDLMDEINPFTRCLSCNGKIIPLSRDNPDFTGMRSKIPDKVLQWCREFSFCQNCGKVYWKGSHYDKLFARIEQIKNTD